MQAIILAAGMGKRLGELTQENTKCMIEVNNIRIVDRLVSQLSNLNLSKIIFVIGYKGSQLQEYLTERYPNTKIEYINNDIYNKTNNIYSLFLAKDLLLKEDTLLLESDLIFEETVLTKLISSPNPNVALVDKYESWMDGTVVTLDEDRNITNFISKRQFDYSMIHKYYKTVNIYKFSKEFSRTHYVPFLEAYSKALGNNEYYEQVLKVLSMADNSVLKALPLNGEKWYEIDDIQDLNIAESIFAKDDSDQWDLYIKRYGGYWRYPKLLDFCYLVNPYFPNKQLIEEIKAHFYTLISEYPSGIKINSLLAAKNFHIKAEYILVGNGAAELIKAYIEKYVSTLGMIYPTFEEYPNRLLQKKIHAFIPDNSEYKYTAKHIIDFFENKPIDTLLLINPDNPSGNYIPYNDVISLTQWTKSKGIKFILDESFVDFADIKGKKSLLDNVILKNNPHLIVIKSISKSYGVPGLRLGVLASGNVDIVQFLQQCVSIWNINSFAEFYMQIFEKYEEDYLKACKLFIKERKRFYRELSKLNNIKVISSEANYFLCELKTNITSKGLAINLLKKYNILIKDCSPKFGFYGKSYIRIAVRNQEDNTKLLKALKVIL